jgi:hypothetical protein
MLGTGPSMTVEKFADQAGTASLDARLFWRAFFIALRKKLKYACSCTFIPVYA